MRNESSVETNLRYLTDNYLFLAFLYERIKRRISIVPLQSYFESRALEKHRFLEELHGAFRYLKPAFSNFKNSDYRSLSLQELLMLSLETEKSLIMKFEGLIRIIDDEQIETILRTQQFRVENGIYKLANILEVQNALDIQ